MGAEDMEETAGKGVVPRMPVKTWQQVVEEIGWFIDQCHSRNDGQLTCEWCPATGFCGDYMEATTCHEVLLAWAKRETGDQ